MTTNYAKDTLGNFVFFNPQKGLPPLKGEVSKWWLWTRPVGSQWSLFRLIGESSEVYCQKNMHVPNMCAACASKRFGGRSE